MDNSELSERVIQVLIAKQSSLIPVKVRSARRDVNSILKMMLADQQNALHCKIVGLEVRLAASEITAIFRLRP